MSVTIDGNGPATLDSNGNLAIGTTSTNYKLAVAGDSATTGVGIRMIDNNASGRTYAIRSESGSLVVGDVTGAATRMQIDSSGNVGIGVTPNTWNTFTATQLGSKGGMSLAAGADNTILASNMYFNSGYKRAGAYASTMYQQGAGAHYWMNAASGAADSAITYTQAMTLDSSGNLLVGTTSIVDNTKMNLSFTSSVNGYGSVTDTTSTSYHCRWKNPNGVVGGIYTNGSSTTYTTSSDYRLKENIQPMTGALEKVAQLNPVTYTWKIDGSAGQGFIAHELQSVVPDCVGGEKDAVDAEGKPVYQGIDTSFLVATLTKAIQELSAKNDALESRIAALEAK